MVESEAAHERGTESGKEGAILSINGQKSRDTGHSNGTRKVTMRNGCSHGEIAAQGGVACP